MMKTPKFQFLFGVVIASVAVAESYRQLTPNEFVAQMPIIVTGRIVKVKKIEPLPPNSPLQQSKGLLSSPQF